MILHLPVLERSFALIKHYYGSVTAKRSQVPLINHIIEGLAILDKMGATDVTKAAFCLHPLVQKDEALAENWNDLLQCNLGTALLLALEYRNKANEWLSIRVHTRSDKSLEVKGLPSSGPLPEIRQMLIADKVQNYKDYLLYHAGTHRRGRELEVYFRTWLKELGVDEHLLMYYTRAAEKATPVCNPPS